MLVKTKRPTPAATDSSSSTSVPVTFVSTNGCRGWDPTCGLCQDWASRAFGASGVADAASGNPLALTRSLTWCPGCGDYIPAPTLA